MNTGRAHERRRFQVGLFLQTSTLGTGLPDWTVEAFGPGGPRWPDVLATARVAEDVGFDSVWVCDHMLMDDDWNRPVDDVLRPPDGAAGCWDAWALLAAIGASTRRVALGPLVGCTAYQHPARLAKLADTIDEISGRRLILGLGAGDHWSEFRRFGVPVERPIARFEEALRIIVPLLREGHVDVEGEFFSARDCTLSPRARDSGPPILIGALGTGPRMARLVVEHADLWNGWYVFDDADPLDDVRAQLGRMDEACTTRGRDPRTLGRTVGVSVALPGFVAEGASITGSHEQIAERLLAYRDAGVDHLQVVTAPGGPAGAEGMGRVLEVMASAGAA